MRLGDVSSPGNSTAERSRRLIHPQRSPSPTPATPPAFCGLLGSGSPRSLRCCSALSAAGASSRGGAAAGGQGADVNWPGSQPVIIRSTILGAGASLATHPSPAAAPAPANGRRQSEREGCDWRGEQRRRRRRRVRAPQTRESTLLAITIKPCWQSVGRGLAPQCAAHAPEACHPSPCSRVCL